jgi:hypothetical protein
MAASVKKPRGEVGSRYVENLPLRGDHWTAELLDVHGRFAMSAKRRQRPVHVPEFALDAARRQIVESSLFCSARHFKNAYNINSK